ncbi:MAG: hypothetical protein ACFFFB_08590 [Candidatus Heimdallarchaeota archaeon]
MKKISEDDKEFITSEELENYCQKFYYNHKTIGNYLISRGYLLNVLDNIYYVKNYDEICQNKLKYSFLELVGKALKYKRIVNWYYGLYTALEILNIDYDKQNQFFYLINDKFASNKPVKILGRTFRFLRFKNALFDFGIIKKKLRYSDLEKTIMDLIYLWEHNQINENQILVQLHNLLNGMKKAKILKYSKYYPKSNQDLIKKALKKI